MSPKKRRSHFDKVYACTEAILPVFYESEHEDAQVFANLVQKSFDRMQPGTEFRESIRDSDIAASQLALFHELFSPQNRRYNDFDRVLAKARKIVEKEYPNRFGNRDSRLGKVIARGKIKTESEFHLVTDRIYELEGEANPPKLLRELYLLVDDFAAG